MLVLRAFPRASVCAFEGTLQRTGSRVPEASLWPTPEYPETPLLIEYAGHDRSGRGHRRSNDLHVLWRYDPELGIWIELARVWSQGPEWYHHLLPIVLAQLRASCQNDVEIAGKATERVLHVLDRELAVLPIDGRDRAMSFLYDAFTARFMSAA